MPQFPDRSYRILIIGGFGSEKANALVNQTIHQPDIDIVYLDDQDPNKREGVGLKHYNDSKVFLLNTQMIKMIFRKVLKNVIQIRNAKS